MAVMAEQACKLLDFGQKLDIQLLDNIVSSMYTTDGEQASNTMTTGVISWPIIIMLMFIRKCFCMLI